MRALACLLCLLPGVAAAGPWPQEKGRVYAQLAHYGAADGWTGLYVEYGGPLGLTFGVDLGGHVTGLPTLLRTGAADRDVDGRIRSFVRAPVPLADWMGRPEWMSPWLAAVELSLGRDFEAPDAAGEMDTVDRIGLGGSVGRGFSTRLGDGWTTLDLATSMASGGADRTTFGLVVGLKPVERVAVELSLFGEREDDLDYAIGPTVQYDLGEIVSLRLGVAQTSDGDVDLSFGLARSF